MRMVSQSDTVVKIFAKKIKRQIYTILLKEVFLLKKRKQHQKIQLKIPPIMLVHIGGIQCTAVHQFICLIDKVLSVP